MKKKNEKRNENENTLIRNKINLNLLKYIKLNTNKIKCIKFLE